MVSKYRVAMYHLEVQFPNVAVTSYCLGSAVSKYRGYQVLFWKFRFHMLGLPGTSLEVHLPNVEVAGYCFGLKNFKECKYTGVCAWKNKDEQLRWGIVYFIS